MVDICINDFSKNVAILQIDNFNSDRIKSYLKSVSKNSIILFSEYILNPFFSHLNNIDINEFIDNNKERLNILKELSKEYNHLIVIPYIEYKNKSFFKFMAIIYDDIIHCYPQQRLISYSHWDERAFFANKIGNIKDPFTFRVDNIKFGVMFGFEAHFDEFWLKLRQLDIDVVLIPTASAFDSKMRWRNLLSSHAFTNSCMVLRANKIDSIISNDGMTWKFYGDSFVALGDNIYNTLPNSENVLCEYIDIDAINKLKKEWGFRNYISKVAQ